jgi:hypothetical protein
MGGVPIFHVSMASARMEPCLKTVVRSLALLGAGLVVVLLIAAADVTFNRQRILYGLLGRDATVRACTQALSVRLRTAGFEPSDIEFGGTPDLALSSLAGRTLKDTFTFRDGAAEARVDGIVACVLDGGTATVDFRTASTPIRPT